MDRFTWAYGDVVINPSCEIAVVIEGHPHPWYRVSWTPDDNVDVAALLVEEIAAGTAFDPTDSVGPSQVEEVLLAKVGGRGLSLTRLSPVPAGTVTELVVTGDADVVIPLG